MVKNPFELYAGGLDAAIRRFDDAYEWASRYVYASLMEYADKREAPFIEKDILGELFLSPNAFKRHAREYIQGRVYEREEPETPGAILE